MDQDRMLAALSMLLQQQTEQAQGAPGVTTPELAQALGRATLTHAERRRLQELVHAGQVCVTRGMRKNLLGEVCRPPVYSLSSTFENADQLPDEPDHPAAE